MVRSSGVTDHHERSDKTETKEVKVNRQKVKFQGRHNVCFGKITIFTESINDFGIGMVGRGGGALYLFYVLC